MYRKTPLLPQGNADSYSEDKTKRPEMVIETVEEFRKERYGIDIFKLETPISAQIIVPPEENSEEARQTQIWFDRIDALLNRPWVMLSAGAGMETFRRILTYAFRAGAGGYLAGRAIWWGSTQAYPDIEAFRTSLRKEGIAYIDEIRASLHRCGKPWHSNPAFAEHLGLAGAGPKFYQTYPASFEE